MDSAFGNGQSGIFTGFLRRLIGRGQDISFLSVSDPLPIGGSLCPLEKPARGRVTAILVAGASLQEVTLVVPAMEVHFLPEMP